MASVHKETLAEKIAALPPEGMAQVEAFVDAINDGAHEAALRADWMKLGTPALWKTWDNSEDAVYDDL